MSSENYSVVVDFLLDPTRKPTKDEVKEMRNSFSTSPLLGILPAVFLSLLMSIAFLRGTMALTDSIGHKK